MLSNHITGVPWQSLGSEVLTVFSSKGAMGIFSFLLHFVDLDGLRTRGKGAISEHLHLRTPLHSSLISSQTRWGILTDRWYLPAFQILFSVSSPPWPCHSFNTQQKALIMTLSSHFSRFSHSSKGSKGNGYLSNYRQDLAHNKCSIGLQRLI